jgi:signal transduction histidine kinase
MLATPCIECAACWDSCVAEALLIVGCFASYASGRYLDRFPGLIPLAFLAAGATTDVDNVVPFILGTAGPWLAGVAIRSRHELVEALDRRKRELEAEQEDLARLATERERARVARELHDIVAHHLAVIVVQAGAGRMTTESTREAGERLNRIREAGDQALAEMDRLVNLLEPVDGAPQTQDISVLVDQAQASGLMVSASGVPPGMELPPEVEQLAYFVVREGLTNVLKHAPGSAVDLSLSASAKALEIELRNSGGEGPSNLSGTGSGLGLKGLRDRVEARGGHLDAGVQNGGWRLHAGLPLA